MDFRENFINELYKINESNFNIKALTLFNYQYTHNPVYASYAKLVKKTPENVETIQEKKNVYRDFPPAIRCYF
jgi:hypothetical protein